MPRSLLLVSLPFLVCLLPASGFAAPVNTPQDAARLVMSSLAVDTTHCEIRVSAALLDPGTRLEAAFREPVAVPFASYLVFIDDHVEANWSHPCRWVFVSQAGEVRVEVMTMPPSFAGDMPVAYTCLPQPLTLPESGTIGALAGRNHRTEFIDWFAPNPKATIKQGRQICALIISGGWDKNNNANRYYADVQFIYHVLVYDYRVPREQIVVCFADGTDPAIDQIDFVGWDFINSNPDLDGDGTTDFNYDATLAGVTSGFADVKALVEPDKHLFIFVTDHGSPDKICLWNHEYLDTAVFKTMLDGISAASVNVVMEQCFSGSFETVVLQSNASPARNFASAARADESSFSGGTFPEFDEYAYWWAGALHGSAPAAGTWGNHYPAGPLPGNPDLNGDGYVSFYEAADRAKAWDAYAQSGDEHPRWSDNPSGCGDRFFLGGAIPLRVSSLESVRSYPNPFRPNSGDVTAGREYQPGFAHTGITFDQMPAGSILRIYTMRGERIAEMPADATGCAQWDVKNGRGEKMASGIYIWVVNAPNGEKRTGKVAVIR